MSCNKRKLRKKSGYLTNVEIVSNHFTDTITKATLAELNERYTVNFRPP